MPIIDTPEKAKAAGSYDLQYGQGAYSKLPQAPIIPMGNTATKVTSTPISAPILKAQTGTYNPPKGNTQLNTTASIDATIAKGQAGQDMQTTTKTGDTQVTTSTQPQNAKQTIQDQIFKILGKQQNVAQDKQKIREEADLAIKEKRARDLSNEIMARKQSYQKQIEALEGRGRGTPLSVIQTQQNDLSRKANRELADLSIQYNIANGDYMAAEKLVNEQIADLNDSYNTQLKTLQVAYDFLQNDMTESEKVMAQQAFQEKENERNFEQQMFLEKYKSVLQQADPSFQLDMDYKQAQIDKIYGEMNPGQITTPEGKVILSQDDQFKYNKEVTSAPAYQAVRKAQDSLQVLSEFEQLFGKTGGTSAVFSPRQNAQLKAKYNATILNLKEFFNLGVLNGPDEAFLRGVLPDPTNKSAFLTIASGGIYSPKANTQAGLDTIKTMIEQTLDDRYQSIISQYGDYDLKTVKDLNRVYVDQKAKLNPKIKEMREKEGLSNEDVIQVLYPQTSFNSVGGDTQNALSIANAIKKVESGGNYNIVGDSGTSRGAYQFNGSNFEDWSRKYYGKVLPFTPEGQDMVAQARIQDLLDQGYNAEQVALIWNGGQPVRKKGFNSKIGLAYDSGAYADKVLKALRT